MGGLNRDNLDIICEMGLNLSCFLTFAFFILSLLVFFLRFDVCQVNFSCPSKVQIGFFFLPPFSNRCSVHDEAP